MADTDPFGRPAITEPIKQAIRDAFAVVPDGKKGALLTVVDGSGARVHVAVRINDVWKVGGAIALPTDGKPYGYVAVEAVW